MRISDWSSDVCSSDLMFPLLDTEGPNPLELFQIWVNLPAEGKLAEPHFAMLWDGDTPKLSHADDAGHRTVVTVIAGELEGHVPPPPPPHSWAARDDTDVAIWHIDRSEEHTSELQSLMRIPYAVFCLKTK